MAEKMLFNKEETQWVYWDDAPEEREELYQGAEWIPVLPNIGLEAKIMKWWPNISEFKIETRDPYGECVVDIETFGEEPVTPLPRHNTIDEKFKALTENQEFLEDCLVEMASLVYN